MVPPGLARLVPEAPEPASEARAVVAEAPEVVSGVAGVVSEASDVAPEAPEFVSEAWNIVSEASEIAPSAFSSRCDACAGAGLIFTPVLYAVIQAVTEKLFGVRKPEEKLHVAALTGGGGGAGHAAPAH